MRQLHLVLAVSTVASMLVQAGLGPAAARADVVEVSSGIDNTLFRYLPANYSQDQKTWLKSNGEGNFFSAGRTNARDEIQRGLLRFDLPSAGIPSNVAVQSVSLSLYVLDVPSTAHPLPDIWLVALPTLTQMWGQGASSANLPVSGAGRGANAQAGDATWFHSQYNPSDTAHYNAANLPASPWTYQAGQPGFWSDAPLTTPAGLTFAGGAGLLGDAAVTLPGEYAPAGVDVRDDLGFVNWSTPQMAADVQLWLDDPDSNFGWIMVGIEDALSKRSFASFENLDVALRPTLTIEYTVVPEPASWVLAVMGAALLAVFVRRKR